MDYLEVENQRLRNELDTHKKEKSNIRSAINRSHPMEHVQPVDKQTVDDNCEEPPEYRENYETTSKYETDSNASSLADSLVGDVDPATMERSVLTESVSSRVNNNFSHLR